MYEEVKAFKEYMDEKWDANIQITVKVKEQKSIPEKQLSILRVLVAFGPLTRPELIPFLWMPSSTVYDNLVKLLRRQLVISFREQRNHTGRKNVMYKANGS